MGCGSSTAAHAAPPPAGAAPKHASTAQERPLDDTAAGGVERVAPGEGERGHEGGVSGSGVAGHPSDGASSDEGSAAPPGASEGGGGDGGGGEDATSATIDADAADDADDKSGNDEDVGDDDNDAGGGSSDREPSPKATAKQVPVPPKQGLFADGRMPHHDPDLPHHPRLQVGRKARGRAGGAPKRLGAGAAAAGAAAAAGPSQDDGAATGDQAEVSVSGRRRRQRKKDVLVVEDNRVCQKITSTGLARGGYAVQVCASGADAVEMAGKQRFYAILMDINMPGEHDGVAATRLIREQEAAAAAAEAEEEEAAGEEAEDDDDDDDDDGMLGIASLPGHVIKRKRAPSMRQPSNAPLRLALGAGSDSDSETESTGAAAAAAAAHVTKIIGLSGCVSEADLRTYREAGMDGAIEKGALVSDALLLAVAALDKDPEAFVLVNGRNELSVPM